MVPDLSFKKSIENVFEADQFHTYYSDVKEEGH